MIALATIAFGRPRLIEEQERLLEKYLQDDFSLFVVDNSPGTFIHGETGGAHDEALNCAAAELLAGDAPYIGFLDHDIFPTQPTTLIDKIEEAGFYGVGQRHAPTGHLYLWPGFAFFSREWLAGRTLDFRGIRGEKKADDGDTGSGLWPLFQGEDWEKLYKVEHTYQAIRRPDSHGLQSWGVERIDGWLHLSNGSGWMNVPDHDERDRLTYEMIAAL